MKMNEIQRKYLEEIESLARELGSDINGLTFRPDQVYVTGKISDYEFWIHDNGDASFSSDWYDRRFEVYDFKNEEEMINKFIVSLKDAIDRREYFKIHPDKSPRPLFNRLFDWIAGMWKNSKNEKK
jgi:hypothetical protein